MYAALYAFLILTSIDNLFRLWQSGTDHDASDGIRFFGVCWYVGCLMFAGILITLIACR